MKWAFTIKQKFKAALIMGIIFSLVFAKNWLDERNVSELGNSFNTFYEDRLLAESYIYRLSDHLYQKKIMLENCAGPDNSMFHERLGQHNIAINTLISDYAKTRLTKSESEYFREFKQNVAAINGLEAGFLNSNAPELPLKAEIDQYYTRAAGNLHQLSGIQVSEGRILNEKSKKIISSSSILTQFELVILVAAGLIIQVLIFAAKSALPKKPQSFHLN